MVTLILTLLMVGTGTMSVDLRKVFKSENPTYIKTSDPSLLANTIVQNAS